MEIKVSLAKDIFKRTFNTVGLNVSRRLPPPPIAVVQHRIDLLFDVGANAGQYAMRTRTAGYRGKIVSFEPLPQAHADLQQNAASDSAWFAHERSAVGAQPGSAEINISQNSYSSSLLPMLHAHSTAAPTSAYVGKCATPVVTIDSVFEDHWQKGDRVFLKIDAQGFESEVLEGALQSLARIHGAQLELSIVPLYEGQQLYQYFFNFFQSRGFMLWSLIPGFSNHSTGQLLQFDAVFMRPSESN